MAKIGYARVSSKEQHLDRQLAALKDVDKLFTDKAYGSEAFRQYLEAEEGTYTILPKSNAKEKWPVDYYVYRERHLIENFFNQLKNFWRIATRYDKLAHVYLERVYLATILIRLK